MDADQTRETIQVLKDAEKIANKYCSDNSETESLERFCSKLWTYFAAGNSQMGLEYKLGTAMAVEPVGERDIPEEDRLGLTKKVPISAGLREEAARSFEFLVSFLGSEGPKDADGVPEKCKSVKNRIGMYKGDKLVLFGQEVDENNPQNVGQQGIVVGEPNALQQLALRAIEKQCPGLDTDALSQLIGDSIGSKEKNAVKGTFFEAILVFSGKLRAATTPKERKAAAKQLKKVLDDKKKTLLAIFRDLNPQDGTTVDAEFDLSVQRHAINALTSEKELHAFIMREIEATQSFIEFMGSDNVVHGGKVSKTGQRADIVFAYKDPAAAKAKADAIGSSVKELDDGSYGVPVGLKRLEKMHGAKFGEINSQGRLDGLIAGRILGKGPDEPAGDRNIEHGFEQAMRERQFGAAGTDRQKNMIDFSDRLTESVDSATQSLVDNQTYIGDDGKIKSQTPATVFGTLAQMLLNTLDFAKITSSLITKAFFNTDTEGNVVRKNFTGKEEGPFQNREKGRELIARSARLHKLKAALEDEENPEDQKAARDYMIKMALVCGSNKNNMSQVIVSDDGQMRVIKHNEIFDLICKAENAPNSDEPTFSFSDSGIKINIQGMTVSLSLQRANKLDGDGNFAGCTTRTECELSTASVFNDKLSGDITMPENSSVLHQYLTGQMALLETLLSQTKMNQVL